MARAGLEPLTIFAKTNKQTKIYDRRFTAFKTPPGRAIQKQLICINLNQNET